MTTKYTKKEIEDRTLEETLAEEAIKYKRTIGQQEKTIKEYQTKLEQYETMFQDYQTKEEEQENTIEGLQRSNDSLGKLIESQQRKIKEIQKDADTDTLTGLPKRRTYEETLSELIQSVNYNKRTKDTRNFSLLIVDIDHFKYFNDTYGHLTGDEVLKEIANTIKSATKEESMVYRFGGEEFIVLLPDVNQNQGENLANKIRETIESKKRTEINTITNKPEEVEMNVSIGMINYPIDTKDLYQEEKLLNEFFKIKENNQPHSERYNSIYTNFQTYKKLLKEGETDILGQVFQEIKEDKEYKYFKEKFIKYSLFKLADNALYVAKNKGRNQVIQYLLNND